MATTKLTVARALIEFLSNQYIKIDGQEVNLFFGVFSIFGHGNVTCLSEALYDVRHKMPTFRGQNEQSMAMSAIAFARAKNRKQMMIATSSIGPGATNMITACGIAYTNSLPLLIISGDYFNNRFSSPVLQQIEQDFDPTISANDCFKPVVKFWDRITTPEQIIHSAQNAINVMLNPATCGPTFIGLCQDVQAKVFDYPNEFFKKTVHTISRPRPSKHSIEESKKVLKMHKKIFIIAGAGIAYSDAIVDFLRFANKFKIPFGTTPSAKSIALHHEGLNIGPVGILGSKSVNDLLKDAEVIIAIGTRLQDFTTASWSNFKKDAIFININTSSFDATKHRSIAVIGDAKEAIIEFMDMDIEIDSAFLKNAFKNKSQYDSFIESRVTQKNHILSYANVIGVLNELVISQDQIILAAGGIPGEFNTIWKNKGQNVIDHEYGFSCMGYEVSGGYGNAIAMENKRGESIVLTGDGSYLMLNSEIYSSILTGHKMIIIVLDNAGFAVINRLQNAAGSTSFNNMIKDCHIKNKPFMIDFVMHAKSMGADGVYVETIDEFKEAFKSAKNSEKTFLIHVKVDSSNWSEYNNAWWEVGIPEFELKDSIKKARENFNQNVQNQRKGI